MGVHRAQGRQVRHRGRRQGHPDGRGSSRHQGVGHRVRRDVDRQVLPGVGRQGRRDGYRDRRGVAHRVHLGHRGDAGRGVVESGDPMGSSDVGVVESGDPLRSLAARDVVRRLRGRHPSGAGSDEWWWVLRRRRGEPLVRASAPLRQCAYEPSWAPSSPRGRGSSGRPARASLQRRALAQERGLVRPLGLPPPVPQRAPTSMRRPSSWPSPSRALRVALRDACRVHRPCGGYGRPARLQLMMKSLMRRSSTVQLRPATLCWSARALSRARVPGSSSAPKRSLTSVLTMASTVPYSSTTTAILRPCANCFQSATSAAPKGTRRAFCASPTCNRATHSPCEHHHRPRPLPRPRYQTPDGARPARVINASLRRCRHTAHVRTGLMRRPPRTLPRPQLLRGYRQRRRSR